jgi:23S rRNA G2445 N2-methylase RlmL
MAEAPISARPHVFYIRPAPGWLELLHQEVDALVKSPLHKYKYEPKVTLLKGTVKLHRCDWRQGLEIMLRLTTAHDVEWLVLESKCNKWSEVDAILGRVPWDSILPSRDIPVHVTTDISNGFTTASGKLRENFCKISNLIHVSEGGKVRFKIDLRADFLKISVSLCGEPLYKRGYKAKLLATAPIAEHQAAACTRWVLDKNLDNSPVNQVFVPFAGSGTFGFESLLVLSGSGPGAFSRHFSCDLFPCTPEASMRFFRKKISEKFTLFRGPKVTFNDINSEAVAILKENTVVFSSVSQFEIVEEDFFSFKTVFPDQGKTLILLNPPYGNRLAKNSSVAGLYHRLGIRLKEISESNPGKILGGCLCPDDLSWNNFIKELKSFSPETHHFTHGGKEMRLVRWAS